MNDNGAREDLDSRLRTLGADLSRWAPEPAAGARRALVSDPPFRRAWEAQCALDTALGTLRDEIADTVARSGAAERVRVRTLQRLPADPLFGLPWQRIAAAVLVAGMLGAALDLVLIKPEAPTSETAALDLADAWGGVELQ